MMKDKANWILHQRELLELERLAEVESATNQVEEVSLKQLEAKGIAISRLQVMERGTGLFGRPTVNLSLRYQQGLLPQLPSHTFSSGDIVGIWENVGSTKGNKQLASGVVSKVTTTFIQIALDEESPELEDLPDDTMIRIHKLANDVTYKRIKRGLDELGKNLPNCSYHLVEVLFKESDPYDPLPQVPNQLLTKVGELNQFNKQLDESQVDAVMFALTQKDLAVVHGPPGTGKTTTLVEIILQHVKLGCKVLAVAPSNLAVDNLLEKLVDSKANVVRVGHPARATTKAQQRSLDALIQNSDEFELIQDIHKDIKNSVVNLSRAKEKGKKFKIKEELKTFRKELKEREMRLSKDILSRCDVVLTTLTSAGNSGPLKLLPESHFHLTVIDECSQGLECACYLATMKAPKLLIAGDHQQLPPTIISTEAAKAGLIVSLMERVIEMYKSRVTRMLKTQYRMNSSIMSWASEALYEGQLKAHDSVSAHLLCQMKDVDSNEDTENALILIDTAGCNFEEVSGDDLSKGNEGEASIVAEQVKRLISSGVSESNIAVISPYNLQVEMIRALLRDVHPLVEVRSVDGFQGREKEAILISLVRSNKQGEIGFLAEDRRLNVAVTRARRQLTLVCDTDTVCRHSFIKALVDHISKNGVVRSGHEFESEIGIQTKSNSYKAPAFQSIKQNKVKREERKTKNEEKKTNKERHQNTEEENQARRKEYEDKISDFIKSDKLILEFPKNLNSFERLLVHDVANKYGLEHSSQGEGRERFIVLKKKNEDSESSSVGGDRDSSSKDISNMSEDAPLLEEDTKINNSSENIKIDFPKPKKKKEFKKVNAEKTQKDLQSIDYEAKSSEGLGKDKSTENANIESINKMPSKHNVVNVGAALKTCNLCQTEVNVRNYDLHVVRCERMKKEREIKVEIMKRQTEIKGVKKKQQKDKGTEEENDDFEIMEKYSKENNSCAYPRCKYPSILLLQLCLFCKNNFCLQHHQAEIHGCGEEARRHARTVLLKSVQNGVLTPGSRVPSKKPDPVKRGQLQKKLNKKLDELEGQRKIKKKEK